MLKLAKEINSLLKENPTIKEYLALKEEIQNDKDLNKKREKLEALRKQICTSDKEFDQQYYDLLNEYKSDSRVIRYEKLNQQIKEVFIDISDILSLK